MNTVEKLTRVCEPALAGAGLELVLIEVVGLPRKPTVRFFIDREEEGGVTIDDCARASRLLDPLIEAAGVFGGPWVLEVSSPGLDRPLTKEADFTRFAGREITLRSRIAVGNQRNFSGVLLGVVDGQVCLRTDAGELKFAFAQVDRARLVPKY